MTESFPSAFGLGSFLAGPCDHQLGAGRHPMLLGDHHAIFQRCRAMKNARNHLYRLGMTAAAILLLGAGSAEAQKVPVPCSAFSRNANGSWRVLSPIILDLNGMLVSPTVGTIFAADAATHGVEMSKILDSECGSTLIPGGARRRSLQRDAEHDL
jgi:hypothetical protein